MRRLIVNGDDFGYTPGVNAGIVRAYRDGILTSTTLMAGGEAFDDAVRVAGENPGLSVGCHLVLVGGQAVAPAGKIPTLADPQGRLPATLGKLVAALSLGRVRQEDLETELRAQVQRICEAGIRPTHVDTHKHTHLHPRVMQAVASVTQEFGIGAVRNPYEDMRTLFSGPSDQGKDAPISRSLTAAAANLGRRRFGALAKKAGLRSPDHFCGIGWTGSLEGERLLRMIDGLAEGTTELMCHPGVHDEILDQKQTRLKAERQVELEALTTPEVRRAIRDRNVRLISFRELGESDA
ncbi:MAG TPA: hopanoid biosynthesis-associated protein HpnK [Candidatus Dormibacteraeota bacterium]|nr:hopanoid biosynthesis-associated protein HpnK [Candidatus Dormibacteraeota bacterium]